MKEQWLMTNRYISDEDKTIFEQLHISRPLARVIANRDVSGQDITNYVNGTANDLSSPWLLKNMDQAVDIIGIKIALKSKIRIIGDYDVDGICSTYILYKALSQMGADVDYAIPHRVEDGYGINEKLIEDAHKAEVDTIITCDNGISASREIDYAKSLGMTVIITDHHEVPFEESDGGKKYILPKADTVINPKQPDCTYPFKEICGAYVALQLVRALVETNELDMKDYNNLFLYAAVATVCDVMDLIKENRTLVKYGLKLFATIEDLGIVALTDVLGLSRDSISSYNIGFMIGPCLNATGRLDTARKAVELFTAKSEEQAKAIAQELVDLNKTRQELTEQNVNEALKIAENMEEKVLVVFLPDCHESIAGIVAGRIREKYNKPTIVLTKSEEGVKGSGRSIEAYNMYEELTKVSDLLTKFGGHTMAAGLSLEESNVDVLRNRLNEQTTLTDEDMILKVYMDDELQINEITESFTNSLDLIQPFGKANPKPSFANRNLSIKKLQIIGKDKSSVRLTLTDSNGAVSITGLIFKKASELLQLIREVYGSEELERVLEGRHNSVMIDIVFYPSINEYNNNKYIQIIIDRFRIGGRYASN